jgi:hypothetical protein
LGVGHLHIGHEDEYDIGVESLGDAALVEYALLRKFVRVVDGFHA